MNNSFPWRWCMTARIQGEPSLDENFPFAPGIKVYVLPIKEEDSIQKMAVIGLPRYSRSYIETTLDVDDLDLYHLEKVENPFVLLVMNASKHTWWDNSDAAKETIMAFLKESGSSYIEKETTEGFEFFRLHKENDFNVAEDSFKAIDVPESFEVIDVADESDTFDTDALAIQEDLMSGEEE